MLQLTGSGKEVNERRTDIGKGWRTEKAGKEAIRCRKSSLRCNNGKSIVERSCAGARGWLRRWLVRQQQVCDVSVMPPSLLDLVNVVSRTSHGWVERDVGQALLSLPTYISTVSLRHIHILLHCIHLAEANPKHLTSRRIQIGVVVPSSFRMSVRVPPALIVFLARIMGPNHRRRSITHTQLWRFLLFSHVAFSLIPKPHSSLFPSLSSLRP